MKNDEYVDDIPFDINYNTDSTNYLYNEKSRLSVPTEDNSIVDHILNHLMFDKTTGIFYISKELAELEIPDLSKEKIISELYEKIFIKGDKSFLITQDIKSIYRWLYVEHGQLAYDIIKHPMNYTLANLEDIGFQERFKKTNIRHRHKSIYEYIENLYKNKYTGDLCTTFAIAYLSYHSKRVSLELLEGAYDSYESLISKI